MLSLPAEERGLGELCAFSWSTGPLITLTPYWARLLVLITITTGGPTGTTSDVSEILPVPHHKNSQLIPPVLLWCPGC